MDGRRIDAMVMPFNNGGSLGAGLVLTLQIMADLKIKLPYGQLVFLAILLLAAACTGPVKNEPRGDYPKRVKTIGSPQYGNVQCSLQDKDGNLWFGTTENGLYKYDGNHFTRFLVADGLPSNNVYCFFEDKDGKIWIGTFGGLCTFDGNTFNRVEIPLPKGLTPSTNPAYRNSHWVYDILQTKSGLIWFLTIDGIYIYDGKTFTPFIMDDASGRLAGNDNAETVFEDKEGNIWLGGRGNKGVFRYDGKSVLHFELEELYTYALDSVRAGHAWAWPQVQDKNGNIWFSNWGGAYRYDGKTFTNALARYKTNISTCCRSGST